MPSSSRKGTPPQPPTIPPKLIVPRSGARQKLEAHIEKGSNIVNRPMDSQAEVDKAKADGEKWRDYAITLLSRLFDNTSVSDKYRDETRGIGIGGGDISYTEERDIFKPRMAYRVGEVESVLERLDLYEENLPVATILHEGTQKDPRADALEKIELITKRFHTVARQLLQRHRDHNIPRDTLKITDEYDVQNLFHALLRLFFDDIRDEEWTPSYAGGASRVDFLLKQEQVLVEIKMTRQGLTREKDVSDQLIIDSERYRVHPDCKMLVAFVYDPQEYLNNPRGIERDLTKTINGVPVKVIIASR